MADSREKQRKRLIGLRGQGEDGKARPGDGVESGGEGWYVPGDTPRCDICRHVLVPCQSPGGPYFGCLCEKWRIR